MGNIYWLLELEIRSGQSEAFEGLMNDMIDYVEEHEPGTINYEWSKSADGKICHIYERYADSAAAMAHMDGFGEFADRFFAVLAPLRFSIYGTPSGEIKAALAEFNPTYMEPASGFARQ